MMRHVTWRQLAVLTTLILGLVLLWRQKLQNRGAPTRPSVWTLPSHISLAESRQPPVVHAMTQHAAPSDLHSSSKSPAKSTPSIPRIIHQTWAGDKIPAQFSPWVQSWMEQNPTWEYWFWTDADIRCFIQHHFPQYLRMFDSYQYNINRADVMRYFVLYAHGGLYADLDMECVRPVDNATLRHVCVLTEENHAHTYVVQRRAPPANVINCLMACRPHHPYFRDVIDELPRQKARGSDGAVLDQTGPFLIDSVLRRYLNASSSRLPEDAILVLPPVYFSARFDPMQLKYLKKTCRTPDRLSVDAQRVCRHLVDNKFVNVLDPVSYADHHWLHTYWNMAGFMSQPLDSLADIARLVTRHPNTPRSSDNCYTPRLKFGPFS